MLLVILPLLVVVYVVIPQYWVRYIMRKYSKEIDDLQGSGEELAQHMIRELRLTPVVHPFAGKLCGQLWVLARKVLGLPWIFGDVIQSPGCHAPADRKRMIDELVVPAYHGAGIPFDPPGNVCGKMDDL